MNKRPLASLAALALPLALVVGCGDEEKSEKSSGSSSSGSAQAALESYFDALAAGDYEASCALESEEYSAQNIEQMSDEGEELTCVDAQEKAAEFMGMMTGTEDPAELWAVEDLEVTEDGDEATASFVLTVTKDDDSISTSNLLLSKVDGTWLITGQEG